MRALKAGVGAFLIVLSLCASGIAGPFDDAKAAFSKGDYATVLRLVRPLAEQGEARAQYEMGVLYRWGWGVNQDYAEALRWFRKAAEQGNGPATEHLAGMYGWGQGVPRAFAEAMRWHLKGAELGHPDAMNTLAFIYSTGGEGVPQDYAEAIRWYRKAANLGHTPSQFKLGIIFGDGKWVPLDFVQAHLWLNLAAASGTPYLAEAYRKLRDNVAERMTPAQIAEAQKLAREWKPLQKTK